jgi:NAD-dependent deacetylase
MCPCSGPSAAVVAEVAGWIQAAAQVTALTGAGISTGSGIPDFRGPDGVWTRDPAAARLVTLADYVADPAVRRRAWRERRDHPAWTAGPNAGHRALVELERAGRLWATVTQNIDGLHQRAGAEPARVVELHGTLFEVECLSCGRRIPMREALDRLAAGDDDPACLVCGGILKSATVAFGQPLDPRVLADATTAVTAADLLLVVGSSLTVRPAADLVPVAARSGARVVIVNAEPTPYDGVADALLAEPIGEVLPALVGAALGRDGPT